MRLLLFFFLILCSITMQVRANSPDLIARAYIDKAKNVHLVLKSGRDKQITSGGRMTSVTLAPDKRTVGWLKLNSWIAEGDTQPQASKLGIYRHGKVRYIDCGPFIRDYWFWMQGKQVATDCGGRHFAGTLTLYDTDTFQEIESFFQPDIPEDKRPAWSKGEGDFERDSAY